jgi:hypothetical protein
MLFNTPYLIAKYYFLLILDFHFIFVDDKDNIQPC